MSSFFDKIKLLTAVNTRTEINLSGVHITTSDFMKLKVAKAIELVPTQSINVAKHQTYALLDPMPVPPFGRAFVHNKSYFVPYRTIFAAWNDFINDVPHQFSDGTNGPVQFVPCINDIRLIDFFTRTKGSGNITDSDYIPAVSSVVSHDLVSSTTPTGEDDDPAFDFCITTPYMDAGTPSISYSYYRLTDFGRFAYDTLRSLGYTVNFDKRLITTSGSSYQSLLPLFSLAKVYTDWFYPQHYAHDDVYNEVVKWFTYDVGNIRDVFTDTDLARIFVLIRKVAYDSDYFTSAWDNPEAPSFGHSSSFVINDITNGSNNSYKRRVLYNGATESSNSGYDNAPILTGGNGDINSVNNISAISKYSLNLLSSLSDYLKRHQLVGSRAIDRYLARFGIVMDSAAANRSIKVNENQFPLQFNPVYSQADTDGAPLGDYAGKGVATGENSYSFSAEKDYGMFIIVSTIVPQVGYYQGGLRHVQHLSKLDFFTPEFDRLGTQPISIRELYVPMDSRRNGVLPDSVDSYDSLVFGFTGRYGEYKVASDNLTGDFLFPTRNQGKSAWTLMRNLNGYVNLGIANLKHTKSFVDGTDSDQYSRIFYNTDGGFDHFNIIHNFQITSSFPGTSLFDTYKFEDEDTHPKVVMSSPVSKDN